VLTGGLGKYSHGSIGLTHQHWVEQVISAGSFGVHCTEAAEAHHKLSMRLSSNRVRHSRQNLTQSAMLKYLLRHYLFDSLFNEMPPPRTFRRRKTPATADSIRVPLQLVNTQGRHVVHMGLDLHEVRNQIRFIHPEVRLARVELMDLLCDRLDLAKTRATYRLLNDLEWNFGQKLVRSNVTFWATDSQYTHATSENACRRRDAFLLRGTETCAVTRPNGDVVMTPTALCCEAVCFLQIKVLGSIRHILPTVPGRYLQLHRDT
jgi:hypothetical protein